MNIFNGWKGLLRTAQTSKRAKATATTRGRTLAFRASTIEPLESRQLMAIRVLDGFDDNTLAAGDEVSSAAVDIGFSVDFFGDTHSQLFVNNNGSVSFGEALSEWDAAALPTLETPLIAPFYADVDTTEDLGTVTYGTDTIDGHAAFAVTWNAVGGAAVDSTLRNTFQVVIIDRSDLSPGNFDLEFNYDAITWDLSFDAVDPLPDVYSRPGFAASNAAGESYELIAAGVPEFLLDTNATFGLIHNQLKSTEGGRYVFEFRGGTSLDRLGLAGQAIEVTEGYVALGRGISPNNLLPVPNNAQAADTTNANRLGPTGDLANLTGMGLTVGLFEANEAGAGTSYPLDTHVDLTGRVTFGDVGPMAPSNHATHVAGTIAGAGPGQSTGMAPAATIQAYSQGNFLNEMAADANELDISNHAYSIMRGWEILDLGLGADVPVWLADRSVFNTEDPAFGKYGTRASELDEVLFNNAQNLATDFLSVWSASDNRDDRFIAAPGINGYVAFFSAPPVGGAPLGFGYWLVPAGGAQPAPGQDGNNGTGYDSLPDYQVAKNSLVVGSIRDVTQDPYPTLGTSDLSTFSSWGGTDDGRVKPDLVANGEGLTSASSAGNAMYESRSGTSSAAANATGSAALVLEHYQNEMAATPQSATLKGALLHNAHDIGVRGPDYASGWGLLDAAAAAQFITKVAAPVAGELHEIHEEDFVVVQNFPIVANQNGTLTATLVWTDRPGDANPNPDIVDDNTRALVNDLDLVIIGPGGEMYFPWSLDPANPTHPAVRTVRNEVDNVEQVVIDAPDAGNYTVQVRITGPLTGASQPFSLLISAAPALIDDVGPQITGVSLGGNPLYDPSNPNPGVSATTSTIIQIGLQDLPGRALGLQDPATNGGNIFEVEPNDTLAMAQDIDRDFNLNSNANIGNTTTNTSTNIPHATILGSGDGTYDYYVFTVANAGVTAIFDIDMTVGFDSTIFLFDALGNPLAPNAGFNNDDSNLSDGQAGSTSGFDSYFEHTFAAPGTYVIGVATFGASAAVGGIAGPEVPPGATYTLHVSVPQHDIILTPSLFQLQGDSVGVVPIAEVRFVPDPIVFGQPATGTIQLVFAAPLSDDSYTLTVFDNLTDPSGNALDGENNAVVPGIPVFPSGNGIPGGDFVAQFFIDATPELAFYSGTTVTVDLNGNGFLDFNNPDPLDRDVMFQFGGISDQRFAGALGPGAFDVFALYGRANKQFRFAFDTNGNGTLDPGDTTTVAGLQVDGLAAAGDFHTNAGDEIAVFDGKRWYLDTNGNRNIDAGDTQISTAMRGYPVVGDFDGNGTDDLGTYQNNVWQFDLNRDGAVDATINFGAPGRLDRPVVADLDGDGIDDLGLWVPDPGIAGIDAAWRWLVSNDPLATTRVVGSINTLNHPFSPVPIGFDRHYQFGDVYALPLVGNFNVSLVMAPAPVVVPVPPLPIAATTPPKSSNTLPTSQSTNLPTAVHSATPTTADVSVSKVAAPKKVVAGANVVFTITVKNTNRGDAQNVLLTDNLPSGMTLISQRQTGGAAFTLSNSGNSISNSLALLPAGAVATFEVVARVDSELADKLKLVNGATVTTSSIDPKPKNNAAATKVTILHAGITLAASLTDVGKQDLIIGGSKKNDAITVRPAADGKVQVLIGGKSKGLFTVTGQIFVYGRAGNDTIEIDPLIELPALLFGGDGNDQLTGGGSNDILVGGGGVDNLSSGAGRNLLFGGAGVNSLNGTSGSNLFVAGATEHDAHAIALTKLLAEWSRTDANYETRIGHLNGTLAGGLNEGYKLNATTAVGNASIDTITADLDEDWFLATLAGTNADSIATIEGDEESLSI